VSGAEEIPSRFLLDRSYCCAILSCMKGNTAMQNDATGVIVKAIFFAIVIALVSCISASQGYERGVFHSIW
jgi:hypothetical protein